jgi:hypothetical protein
MEEGRGWKKEESGCHALVLAQRAACWENAASWRREGGWVRTEHRPSLDARNESTTADLVLFNPAAAVRRGGSNSREAAPSSVLPLHRLASGGGQFISVCLPQ